MIPNVLTIAGSDSGGGAGVQADLKTMGALGVYGCSVLTALTAQNTRAVTAIHQVPSTFISTQLETVFEDISIHATKIGMLATSQVIRTVATALRSYSPPNIVLDPVMVATSGAPLLVPDAISALMQELIPLSKVLTPNLPEVSLLLDQPQPKTRSDMEAAGHKLKTLGCEWVLIKGGHLEQDQVSADVLIGPHECTWLEAPRIQSKNTHGTGCTLSSAIAAYLAKGLDPTTAIRRAKGYVTQAITHSEQLSVGKGHGPVNHFYALPSDP